MSEKRDKRLCFIRILISIAATVAVFIGTIGSAQVAWADEIPSDGVSGRYDNVDWALSSDGILTIGKSGETQEYRENVYRSRSEWPWYRYRENIKEAKVVGNVKATSVMKEMFYECENMQTIDISKLDTSNATQLYSFFAGCKSLKTIDLSHMDTSNVTSLAQMFRNCSSLETVTLPDDFVHSNITSIGGMFSNCSALSRIDSLSEFDTRNVTNMAELFAGCETLTNIDVSSWNTHNVEQMEAMFRGCTSVTSLNVSNFYTGNVKNMAHMFNDCKTVSSLDVSRFDTSKVENMTGMFRNCSSLLNLDVTHFNTRQVRQFYLMFSGCKEIESLDIANFDMSGVIASFSVGSMFSGMTSCRQYKLGSAFDFDPLQNAYSAVLPTPPTTDGYNGKWTSNAADPTEQPQYTPAELSDAYNSSMAGTYVWAREASAPATYTITYHSTPLAPRFADNAATHTQTKTAGVSATITSDVPGDEAISSQRIVTYDPCGGEFAEGEKDWGSVEIVTVDSFASWNTQENGSGKTYAAGSSYTTDADLELWAQKKTTRTNNSSSLPVVTRNGFVFNGWYTAAEGGDKVGDAGQQLTEETVSDTMYAHWTERTASTYTITYHAGNAGGTFGGSNATRVDTKAAGESLIISDVIPDGTGQGAETSVELDPMGGTIVDEASGYDIAYIVKNTFVSWNTKEDGTGTSYAIGDPYTEDADLDLWAIYDGETINESSILPDAVRAGFRLAGWYTDETGGIRVGGAGDQIPLDNWVNILYAHWDDIGELEPLLEPVTPAQVAAVPAPVQQKISSTGDPIGVVVVLLACAAVGATTALVLRRRADR